MKRIHFIALFLFSILLLFSSFKHPIKLTASLIEYDEKSKSMKMECRVFIDDFEKSINKRLTKDIDVTNLTEEDKFGIEDYFKQYYSIAINGKRMSLQLEQTELMEAQNIIIIKFAEKDFPIKKGDKLTVENILFFVEFGELQSNRVTLRMPPFLNEHSFQSSINRYSFYYTF